MSRGGYKNGGSTKTKNPVGKERSKERRIENEKHDK
jgi:hypothetical protein